MSGIVNRIFGGGADPNDAAAKAQQEAAQRRQLAELAVRNENLDEQASRSSSRRRGRSLLEFSEKLG